MTLSRADNMGLGQEERVGQSEGETFLPVAGGGGDRGSLDSRQQLESGVLTRIGKILKLLEWRITFCFREYVRDDAGRQQ